MLTHLWLAWETIKAEGKKNFLDRVNSTFGVDAVLHLRVSLSENSSCLKFTRPV